MKKLIAVSFLSLIFISQCGYYLFYVYEQHLIKEKIKEELLSVIPESSLEIIIEEQYAKKIEWEEDGKEFYLNGNLYDVAKTKKVNGQTLLYCLNDKNERELMESFARAVHGNHGKPEKQTIKNQLSVYIIHKTEIEPLSVLISSSHFSTFAVSLKSSFKEIAAPPPKA